MQASSSRLPMFLQYFQVDEKQKTVLLTEQGYQDAEEILDVKDLYDPREQWALYILNAIKAKELFLKDVNYIIRGKEILIVDEFTGRVMQVLDLVSLKHLTYELMHHAFFIRFLFKHSLFIYALFTKYHLLILFTLNFSFVV